MKAKVLICGDGGKNKELARLIAKCNFPIIIPIEKHDTELLDKLAEKFIEWDSNVKGTREDEVCFFTLENILKGIEELKAEVTNE